jgi:hypothetical protein
LSNLEVGGAIIDRKPSYYEFANQTVNLSSAEVFAKLITSEDASSIPPFKIF